MKCRCGRKAVYYRRFEGSALCKKCFLKSIERKVKRTVRNHKLIRSGDRIAFALSGGKDSSAALCLMHDIISPRRDMEMFAITIDEGISSYRPKTIKTAKKLCKELGIEHYIFSFKEFFGKTLDQKVKEIKNCEIKEPCTYCGVGRRYILNLKARELGATKICTGHNLDDEVQSIIMNYIRGDILRAGRLGPVTDFSIRKKHGKMFIPRIKPLREIPEKEVALYIMLKNINVSWDECPYASGIRFDVRDFINNLEKKYPGIKYTILYAFDKIVPYIRKASVFREGEILKCKKCGEPASRDICKVCELWRA